MKQQDIPHWRLHNQQVSVHHFTSVKTLVAHMGAMQAQDEGMWRWAVGIRLEDPSLEKVEKALDKGEIFRTHVLRPTWHLVAAQDIHWMLELTAPHIKKLAAGRHRELELTPSVLTKTRKIIEKLLAQKKYATRSELDAAFTKAGIATTNNRLSHILFAAELESLIASGPSHKGKHTYALLEERVKQKKLLHRDEALAELALRYFTSHGPATLADFSWWSGLNLGDARKGLESIQHTLEEIKINEQVYWMKSQAKPGSKKNQVFFLPAFDEYLISYKDRSAVLEQQHNAKALSANGISYPLILVNGLVAGTWKRSFVKNEIKMETKYFSQPAPALQPALKKAAAAYAAFMGKKHSL